MPWRFGWKHEYWDGHARLTPRHHHVHVYVRVGSGIAAVAPSCLFVRSVVPADAEGLVEAFIETFEDGVEFCDWPVEKFHEHAQRNITDYFAGQRGTPLLATSRLALDGEGRVAGAALVCGREEGPVLDLLMVRPGFRRRGVASTLVGAAVEGLHAGGVAVLRSAYHVANEESTYWHRTFGFEEEPDLNLARLRRVFFYHEMSRHEGLETEEARREHVRLASLHEIWSRRCEELEEVAEREGSEVVMPALRYRW